MLFFVQNCDLYENYYDNELQTCQICGMMSENEKIPEADRKYCAMATLYIHYKSVGSAGLVNVVPFGVYFFNFISFILIYYYTATSLEYYWYCWAEL